MIYGSVCSGIEAATVAWHPLGWKPAFFSEVEKFPRAVLSHHYPDVPLHGDFTTIGADDYGSIDLLCGGTPCQSFSIAGLRKGLADERGNLSLEFIRLAERKKSRWLVWENVPGVLSADGGRAFGSFLGGLAQCGYGFSYRVLDAQYFGVPQRRRRVIVVGYLGDWRPAAAVLFESEILRGDITPSRKAREETAGTIGARTCRSIGAQDADCGHLISTFDRHSSGEYGDADIASTISQRDYKSPSDLITYKTSPKAFNHQSGGDMRGLELKETAQLQAHQNTAVCYGLDEEQNAREELMGTLKSREKGGGFEGTVAYPINTMIALRHNKLGEGTGLGIGENGDPAFTTTKGHTHAVAYGIQANIIDRKTQNGGNGLGFSIEQSPTLTKADRHAVSTMGMHVRRLTPRECERLQGFPDDYTKISEKTSDGSRYKSLGNSWAVPKFRWIGERIQMVDDLIRKNKQCTQQ